MTSARLRPATALFARAARPWRSRRLAAASAGWRAAKRAPARAAGNAPTRRRRSSASAPRACCASPRRSRWTPQGDVYVADQLSYVVQKFTAAGAFETEWGSYGGGHGQFGPIGGLATDAAGNVYVVDSSHNRIEKFDANGNFITAWGHSGSELGPVPLRLLPELHQAAGRRHRGRGQLRVRRRQRQQPHRALQPRRQRSDAVGLDGKRPRAVLLPARRRGERDRGARQPTTTTTASRNSTPTAPSRRRRLARDGARDSSASPTASRWTRRATRMSRTTSTTASSSSPRNSAFAGAWGGFGSKPGQLAFPRALASDPAGDTYVADTANDRVEVFDPEGRLPAHARRFWASARRC